VLLHGHGELGKGIHIVGQKPQQVLQWRVNL
jgi:hypothetical protein